MFDYARLLMPLKKNKRVNLNFTGGEPQTIPNFLAFGEWLRNTYNEQYKDDFTMNPTAT